MQTAEQATEQKVAQRRAPSTAWRPGQSGNPSGYRLSKERARLEEEERQAEAAALAADLGHVPTRFEKLLITEAAACVVEARKLRRQGKSTIEVTRMLDRIVGRLGLGKPAEAPVESYAELSARIGREAGERRRLELEEDAKQEASAEAPSGSAGA